jgi:hypothetical protein
MCFKLFGEELLRFYRWCFSPSVRSVCSAINVYNLACNNCSENCTDVLFSNKITFLMDLLIHQLTVGNIIALS